MASAARSPRQLQPLSLMFPVELRASMQEMADRRFLSLAAVVREACRQYADREKREQAHADA